MTAGPGAPDHFERLRIIVAQTLDVDVADIDGATCAANTPEWDSLAHLMILAAVEKAFATRLPKHDAYRVKNLGELHDVLAQQLGKADG